MINVIELLEQLPDKGFELNLVQAELCNETHVIKGTGRLAQNDEHELRLTIINAQAPDYDQEVHHHLMTLNDHFDQTRIVGKNDYYKLTAIDEFGNHVTCEYIDLQENYQKRVYRARLRFNLWIKPNSTIEAPPFDRAQAFFRNQYDFARFHDVWEHAVDDLQCSLKKKGRYLQFELLSSNRNIDPTMVKQATESLDFVMGLEHEFDYIVYTGKKFTDWQIEVTYQPQAPINTSTFTPPYRRTGSQGDEEAINSLLFKDYYQFLKSDPKSILTKWHKRIVDSGTGYYYKHGMILSIGIEKILRVYYPYQQENQVAIDPEEIAKLIEFSETLSDKILQTKLKNFVKGLPSQNYVPKRILTKLEEKHIISQGSQKSWTQLRNTYAHGSDYNDDMHQAIDLVRKNVTLYYELIFHQINYQGRYTNYFQPRNRELINYPPTTNI